MRNLYSRLGVSASASVEEIRAAIAACPNASVRVDATEVLLLSDRKRSYDGLHSALTEIGELRAALGLSHGDNWRGEVSADYTLASVPARSRYDEFQAKLESHAVRQAHRRKEMERRARVGRIRRAVGAGVGGVGSLVADLATATGTLVVGLVKAAGVLIAAWAAIYLFGQITESRGRAVTAAQPAPPPRAVMTAPPVALPYSGTIRNFAVGVPLAPFEIKTGAGANYLVKLEDAYLKTDVMDVFVRGGDTIKVKVPVGTYVVKYAAGTTWYGYEERFGAETAYSKAESTFDFRYERNGVTGYTITLYQVPNGNLHTRSLNAAEF